MIRIMAVFVSRWSVRITSRIWAWIVTSSAVVGSSAMSSSGSQARAMAIMTRCAMPPDSSCGNASRRRFGSGMPTIWSSSSARARASRRFICRCSSSISPTCMPTSYTGFRLLVGCWKIMLIRSPRMFAHVAIAQAEQVDTVEDDLAGVDPSRRHDEAHDRQARDALAAAGLADEAHDLAAVDVEVDAGDRPHHAVARVEARLQPAHVEQPLAGLAEPAPRRPAPRSTVIGSASGRARRARRRRAG